MDYLAQMSSHGWITLPEPVRERLSLDEGSHVLFRIQGDHAFVSRVPGLLELAGTVATPTGKQNVPWDEVLSRTRDDVARRRIGSAR